MGKIIDIKAREVLDSRGNPTVEAEVIIESGYKGLGIVPSGASTGIHEALELRDGGIRYLGKGVLTAVDNILKIIKPKLIGIDSANQELVDQIMLDLDGTENKSNLGANAILAVSIANAQVNALEQNQSLYKIFGNGTILPSPMMNIINGGMHADNNVDFQEFMIVPKAETFKERLRIGAEVFHNLKKILKSNGFNTGVGDEGGFAPNLESNKQALDFIIEAVEKAGYTPGEDVSIALDVAASSFYDSEKDVYNLSGDSMVLNQAEMIKYYEEIVEKYPIISIEDPLHEEDFEGFRILTEKIGHKIQIVGDDLFVTNVKLLQKGIDNKVANAILVKINQIGSITEAINCIKLAQVNNYGVIVSHRSGETEDTTIADLAVGMNAGQIKTGSLSRSERICKYNRLIRIEEELNGN